MTRLLRRLFFLALFGGACVAAALVAGLSFGLQSAPAVQGGATIGTSDIQRAHALVRLHDPRQLLPGQQGQAVLTQHEVQLLADRVAARVPGAVAARVAFIDGSAQLHASARLPAGVVARAFGAWLNVELWLAQTGGLPVVESLRVGRVPVPRWLAEPLLRRAAARAWPDGLPAADVVQQVRFGPERVQIGYVWQGDSTQRVLSLLVPAEDQARLRAYTDHLAALVESLPAEAPDGSLSLPQLLQPLFELARQRSAAGAPAAAENRAALLTLASYVTARGLGRVVPAARTWPQPRQRPVLLRARVDFPQHLLVSATLAAEGGGPLADAIGIYKELLDARAGSGFSFNDIAADRAGTLLGLRAVRDAAALQAQLAAGVDDAALLPDVSDLPEFMSEPVFRQRYGSVGSPAYAAVLADIEARLQALPLLR